MVIDNFWSRFVPRVINTNVQPGLVRQGSGLARAIVGGTDRTIEGVPDDREGTR